MTVGSTAGTVKRSSKSVRQDNVFIHIFTPRIYQVALLDTAREYNTVACLGSGSAKTFIAVMLIKELAYKLRHHCGADGMKTFFFVESGESAAQYARVIGLHTNLLAEVCLSEDENEWHNVLTSSSVILTTAVAFLSAVNGRLVKAHNISMAIFDDCQLVSGVDHDYVKVVKYLHANDFECIASDSRQQQQQPPLILGLTSSILDDISSPTELELRLATIESSLKSCVEMTSDAVIADPYGSRPRESTFDCDKYNDATGLVEQLTNTLQSALGFIAEMQIQPPSESTDRSDYDVKSIARLVLTETERVLRMLGPWCAARAAAAFVHQLTKLDKPSDDIQYVLMRLAATVLRAVEKTVDVQFDRCVQTLEDFGTFISPKALKLIDVLRDCKPEDNFVIMSGDFDGDFQSDDGCADSDDSMDDEVDDGSASGGDKKTSGGSSVHKISSGETEKNSSSSQHYIAIRRTVCNGDSSEPMADSEGVCGVVFVSHRHIAFALNKLIVELCNWDPDLYFVRSHYIATYNVNAASSSDTQRQKQENVLRKFRQREYNVLIATTMLEEGVELPRCNLIVRFDRPNSYRSYMLSKGRARASSAKYCILVDNEDAEQFSQDLATYRGIEQILLNRCRNKDDYSSEPIDETLLATLMPPYRPMKDDSSFKVTMTSAIRIVNRSYHVSCVTNCRYCAKLPSDAFTHLAPRCRIELAGTDAVGQQLYRAHLQLPINSPIKWPIMGDPMPGKRLAQMAVALKACAELHQAGELDNHLQPVGRELIRYEDEDCEWEDHELHGQARPGSTKRKQYYFKKVATALLGRPHPDIACCLYAFQMKLTCPITEEQNTRGRPIHAPEDTLRSFGFLCERKIPASVPSFPVFTRSGEVTVSVELVNSELCLSSAEIKRLYEFHRFVFCHVLRLEKSPMIFDPQKALTGNIVVPINKNGDGADAKYFIDWPFIELIEKSPLATSIRQGFRPTNRLGAGGSGTSVAKPPKEPFVFDENIFADAVVMPSYRNIDQPQYFYVAEIRHDLTPRSAFPSPELYETFEHYYKSKYNLTLTSSTQPLLDVDHTSARLNLLTPRYVNQKGVPLLTSSATTRRAKRESLQQKQILVPELCDVHPFPASLWRKAVCLPAMLYRTNCLLIAEELRALIAVEARIGSTTGSFPFRPLKFEYCEKPVTAAAAVALGSDEEFSSQSATGKGDEVEEATSSANSTTTMTKNEPCKAVNGELFSNVTNENDELRRQHNCGRDAPANQFTSSVNGVPNGAVSNTSECSSQGQNSCDDRSACDDTISATVDQFRSKCAVTDDDVHNNHVQQSNVETNVTETVVQCGDTAVKQRCPAIVSLDADTSSAGGPSPCDIIQTLTMSNANDFFNLERLETIGDSFLKFAVTIYLYCTYPGIHEGKLSYLRSLQVSNYNLYRLGKKRNLPECMVAVKFEPSENWLPPAYTVKSVDTLGKLSSAQKSRNNRDGSKGGGNDDKNKSSSAVSQSGSKSNVSTVCRAISAKQRQFDKELEEVSRAEEEETAEVRDMSPESSAASNVLQNLSMPYCLQMQHSLPDKSIADCVEALIGCYLASCGRRSALLFMNWLGLRVLPPTQSAEQQTSSNGVITTEFGCLPLPASPLLVSNVDNALGVLEFQLDGFEAFEEHINYRFRDRSYLLQAFTHASYHYNNITDCYQRLEFLGDAILDYVITRHLFEDSEKHSPGVLTDLRSALVNNNMFACLAVRWKFHKYFKALSPQLFNVIEKFVLWQMEHGYQVILDEEMGCSEENDDEDIEIPKALGDIFESVAGAIYLDSGMSLDAVWTVYYRMMKPHIDAFLEKIPKSPVRELLEMEPETAKFEKPERTIDGKVRVCVNVVGKGTFTGVGRNYRIAKSAAAKRALKVIKMIAPQSTEFPLVICQ